MNMHARVMKLDGRLASPNEEPSRPSLLEPILLLLFIVMIGSLLEML
jgi:hypothetical protein